MLSRLVLPTLAVVLALAPPAGELRAGEAGVKLLLPLGRTAYQTNEWIDVSVVRSSPQPLSPSDLVLTLAGRDGGKVVATFAAPAVAVRGKEARGVEHLHVNGWLLRPGAYKVEAAVDGGAAGAEIEVFSHVRRSSFRLVNWGRAETLAEKLVQGEDSFGFNLYYGNGAGDDEAGFLRAGVDFMANCVMSGGHQMDLRQECDWSDPRVARGGTRRVVRRAMIDRTRPNVPGVHFYDEPGLTWEKDPATGETTPHAVRSQAESYAAAFGGPPLSYREVDPKNPEHVARWRRWAVWKLGLMDAAWREAQFGVSRVRPDFLSVTQSQYGWSAFTDGYYFNVARSLPVASGHGGYHDYGPGYFNPSYTLEMARARDFAKPCWYLPTWYGNTTPDQFRLEQFLAFQTNVQGMTSPPDLEPSRNAVGRQGIVETNQLFQKLGPIFTTMPVTKPPVAMLYSLSQAIHAQTLDRNVAYVHGTPQGANLPLTYLAGKLLQQQFLAVLDEDVLDGTLADDHKAVVLTALDYLDPQVVAALERFAASGGLVLLTADCAVAVKGAVKLPVAPRLPDQETVDKLMKAQRYADLGPYTTTAKYLEGAAPLAKAIKAELDKVGVQPAFHCDAPAVVATRQASADVEYLFAVNAAPDAAAKLDPKNTPKAVAATITLGDPARPVYDAVRGGPVAEFKAAGGRLVGAFRFGPGQMRVFARTARPIGGVRVSTPVVSRDLTRERAPIRLDVGAYVFDDKKDKLAGSIPLHVQVVDPLGLVRHELYRGTDLGDFKDALPLAADDPAGVWTVAVRELLSGAEASASFTYRPPTRATSIVGATSRAVSAADDRENAFRFARTHHDVSLVLGSAPYCKSAARRLAEILRPWGVRCVPLDTAEASKPRPLGERDAATWIGLDYASRGQIKPGDSNPPKQAGFAVQGPVILLGAPEDNPIIKFLKDEKFLPYAPSAADFPGPGRGMLAWQRDGIGPGQESIALIAYDEEGMAEAVGSFYEAVAGIEPLTKWTLPKSVVLAPAVAAPGRHPAARVVWSLTLPDRVVALSVRDDRLSALTHDGSLTSVTAEGKVGAASVLDAAAAEAQTKEMAPPADPAAEAAARKQDRPDRLRKLAAASGGRVAVAYWGGTFRVAGAGGEVVSEQQLPQDVTALAWLGGTVVAGLADGRVLALEIK